MLTESNKDVKPESSAAGVKSGTPTTEELLAISNSDNERLKKALASLQAERDEKQDQIDAFEEVEERNKLSKHEETKKKVLTHERDDINDLIDELKSKPEAKPWFVHVDREIEKATIAAEQRGSKNALTELAADLIEDLAQKEGMKSADMLNALRPYFGQFSQNNAHRQVQLSYKVWQEYQLFRKKSDELAKREAQLQSSLEDGTRQSRATTLDDAIKLNDKASQRELLGINHKIR